MSLELEILNETILDEANKILYKLGLHDLLGKYGNPHVSGSYLLNMMTWRDLDIYLESDEISQADFFELGKEISIKLEPLKMNFRNERIGKTSHLPHGLYWGIHTHLFGEQWKIDIWAISSDEVKQKQESVEELNRQMDEDKRKSILTLKYHLHHHPKYRKEFFSVDIYEAVVHHQVVTVKRFEEWLFQKNGIIL